MTNSERRKIILINREFQLKIIAKIIGVNIVVMVIFGLFLYMFLNSEIQSNLYSAHVKYQNIKEMLFPIVVILSIINIITSSLIIGLFVLFASHKIAGPFYKFNNVIDQISNRNLKSALDLRDGDQLYEFSMKIKRMSGTIKEDITGMKGIISEIKNQQSKKLDKEKLSKKIKELEKILDQYSF